MLSEKHVTRAAENIGITQSAMSITLSKLRQHYNDELLLEAQMVQCNLHYSQSNW